MFERSASRLHHVNKEKFDGNEHYWVSDLAVLAWRYNDEVLNAANKLFVDIQRKRLRPGHQKWFDGGLFDELTRYILPSSARERTAVVPDAGSTFYHYVKAV